jgi:hypothetical protein
MQNDKDERQCYNPMERSSYRQSSDSNNLRERKPQSSEKSRDNTFAQRAKKGLGVAFIGALALQGGAEARPLNDQPTGLDRYGGNQTSVLALEYSWLLKSSNPTSDYLVLKPLSSSTFSEKMVSPRTSREEVSQGQADTPSSSRNPRSRSALLNRKKGLSHRDVPQRQSDTPSRQLERDSSKRTNTPEISPDLQPYYDAFKQNKEAQKVLKDVLNDEQTQKAFKGVLNDEQAMRGINSILKNEEFKQQALAQLGDEASLNEAVSVLKYEETLTFVRQMGRRLAGHEVPAPGHDASASSPEKDAPASQYQKYDSQRDSQCVQSPDGTWSCNDAVPSDNSSDGSSNLGIIAGVAGTAITVMAVLAFVVCCHKQIGGLISALRSKSDGSD